MLKTMLAMAAAALALTLGGCWYTSDTGRVIAAASAPVGPQTVADARNTVYGLKALYGAALRVSVEYSRLPSCTTAPAPCSTDSIVKGMAAAQPPARRALDAAEAIALTTSPDASRFGAAVAAAKAAYAEFNAVVQKTGN